MPYGETKVYCDGSHYIAIPHTTNPHKRTRCKTPEELITVKKEPVKAVAVPKADVPACETAKAEPRDDKKPEEDKPVVTVRTTRKRLVEELYAEHINLSGTQRRKKITAAMRPYFGDEEEADEYVRQHIARKYRNLVSRRIRLMRKVNLQDFNYFVTFTYDDAIHTEVTFKKRLRNTLSHLCARKGWKYIGVWERSPEKKRLHFHGIFHVPEGTLPGIMTNVAGYSFSERKRQVIQQNDYFRSLFGRNDFKPILDKESIGEAVAYILKYIEKSGEKIVYSRGLPQYFISDVMDEDVVCPCGTEDKKLLLFDDFVCWDEGCYVGTVSKSTIRRMRKSN